MDQAALETALQDFIVNLAGMEFGAGGHPGLQGGAPGGAQFHFVNPGGGGGLGVQLHGNPGDYAWGRGGLDAIITQLLNHMDGTGPPPMAKENIADIPTVKMTSEMLEKNSSCSVCWEDFTDGEEVKKLECDHCFHSGCIVPWLELHGTCPVCRKELGRSTASGSQRASTPDPVPPHLDEATGGAPAPPPPADTEGAGNNSQRRASVTVSGSGGLTGLIQSALNQVFASSWTGSPGGSSSSSSSSDSSRSPSQPTNQQPPVASQGRVPPQVAKQVPPVLCSSRPAVHLRVRRMRALLPPGGQGWTQSLLTLTLTDLHCLGLLDNNYF